MNNTRFCKVCGNDQSFHLSADPIHGNVGETNNQDSTTTTTLTNVIANGYKPQQMPRRTSGLHIFRRSLSEYDDDGNPILSPLKNYRNNALVTYDDL